MGTKNRIFLGNVTAIILHYHRNIYISSKLFISKKKSLKILLEHPLQANFIVEHSFQDILDSTIASCSYKEDGVQNFIALVDSEYLIYGISTNNYHNELSTVFKPSVRQLVKCKNSITFFSSKYNVEFEEYIKN